LKNQLLVYFATPYTHPEPQIVMKRFVEVSQITAQVLLEVPEIVPFTPIGYTHQFGHLEGIDWLDRVDYRMLKACDASIFIQMQGWSKSEGMLKEKRFCQQNGIPLFYALPEDVVKRCREIWHYREDYGIL